MCGMHLDAVEAEAAGTARQCGSEEGATAFQPPASEGRIWAPPCQGARLDALRPAWPNCMPTLIGECALIASSRRAMARSLASL